MSLRILAIALLAAGAAAEETIYLETTVVSGDQALPRVLYIQPWKTEPESPPRPTAIPGLPPAALGPIYPHEYRRAMRQRLSPTSIHVMEE